MLAIDNILLLLAGRIMAESAHNPAARYVLAGIVIICCLAVLAAIAFLALVVIGIMTRRQPPRTGYTAFAVFLVVETVISVPVATRFFAHLAA